MENYEVLIKAINNKKIVKLKVNSKSKGIIIRHCIPFDYGKSRKYKDGLDRFHFWDLDSPEKIHNLSILPEQLLKIELTNKNFEPGDYVKWKPNWIIKRDWGNYS